ncbi:MAG: class I SAM-dependent methyltransferase [Proteobacteria bacterium]|nr:class I SAM-dependent methyltransferase [Pseudomonadota bacterium]MBU1582254.1 class I SAM-dependent methyltransferase [Pseudomonadota bacterium]MBU2452432.1 class I SAM-dependent methyltransferase [Pseudomonadota bacterium]MBU2632026.1 class I SAM-dependent methyltransferase [Pseudomonadota bacterium]
MAVILDGISNEDKIALEKLVKKQSKPGMVVIELGSYTGKSSISMLPVIAQNNGRLYCVDWFKGMPCSTEDIQWSYKEHNILDIFLNRIKDEGYEKNTITLIGRTDEVCDVIGDNVADLIFIDADHRYENVRKDILKWYPKLKNNGVLCGHDYLKHLKDCNYLRALELCEENVDMMFGEPHHYGVIRSISEFFPDVKFESSIWHIEKTDSHPLLELSLKLASTAAEHNKTFSQSRGVSIVNQSSDPLQQKRHEELNEHIHQLLENEKYSEMVVTSIGSILWNVQLTTMALELLQTALSKTNGSDNSMTLTLYAVLLFKAGNVSLSIECFEKLNRLRPDDPVILNKLGELYYSIGKKEQAEIIFKKTFSLALNYYFPELLNNLGVLYWEAGKKELALKAIIDGMNMTKGTHVNIVLNYSDMLQSQKKADIALSLLERHYALSKDSRIMAGIKQLKDKGHGMVK